MRPAAGHLSLPRLLVVAAVVVVATGVGPLAGTASADDAAVEVRLDGYAPAEVTVRVGDTVTWTWVTDGHSVTHDPDEGDPAFDSHPECARVRPLQCGARGDEFSHTFDTAGTYVYRSRVDDEVRGTVVVEPAPAPTQEPSSPPTAGDDDPSPSPDPTDAEGSGGSDTDDDDSSASGDESRASSHQHAPAQQLSSSGDEGGDAAPTPEVATRQPSEATTTSSDEPSFEDFPAPADPSTDTSEEVTGEVAVGAPDGSDTARLVWGVLGGATVLGTAAVFTRTVLFGDAWDGSG